MSHNDDLETQYTYKDYEAMADSLLARQPHRPTIGIICGSGMMNLANKLEERFNVPYEKIPNFPISTVDGHIGQFAFGTLKGKKVVMMQGRFHMYEGYPAWKVMSPVRVMKLMGVDTLIVTSASGGLNPSYQVGDIVVIIDHIGIPTLGGFNPLRGQNDEKFGSRFFDMATVYDEKLRTSTLKVAEEIHCSACIREGIYTMVGGPAYETPAEARYLRSLGSDVVGMSTVPEVLAARHCGMRVLGLSLVTAMATMDYTYSGGGITHEEVLETAKWRSVVMQDLITGVVDRMDSE